MIWIGLIAGLIVGALSVAILAAGKQPASTLEDCIRCQTEMCSKCNVSAKLERCRAECKALEEILESSQRRCAQFSGENCRLLGRIYYNNNLTIARQ